MQGYPGRHIVITRILVRGRQEREELDKRRDQVIVQAEGGGPWDCKLLDDGKGQEMESPQEPPDFRPPGLRQKKSALF